jgi:hypothetical protein
MRAPSTTRPPDPAHWNKSAEQQDAQQQRAASIFRPVTLFHPAGGKRQRVPLTRLRPLELENLELTPGNVLI